jgi:hypothetical protein
MTVFLTKILYALLFSIIGSTYPAHLYFTDFRSAIVIGNQDSLVDIEMVYGLDSRGSITGTGKVFLFSTASRTTVGPTQPPIQGYRGLFSRE